MSDDPANSQNISLDGYTRSLAGLLGIICVYSGEILWKKQQVEKKLKKIGTTTVDVVPLDTKDVHVEQSSSKVVHFKSVQLSPSGSGTKKATVLEPKTEDEPVAVAVASNPKPELNSKLDQVEGTNPIVCPVEWPGPVQQPSILYISTSDKPSSMGLASSAQDQKHVSRYQEKHHPCHIPYNSRRIMNRCTNCKCLLCQEVFPNMLILRRHCRTHQNPAFPYLCSACSEWITCKSEAFHHLSLHG